MAYNKDICMSLFSKNNNIVGSKIDTIVGRLFIFMKNNRHNFDNTS
jgi:hypothetical protein